MSIVVPPGSAVKRKRVTTGTKSDVIGFVSKADEGYRKRWRKAYSERVGRAIDHACERFGVTQNELERRAGVSKGQLSKARNDHRLPDAVTILRVHEATGASFEYLLKGEGELAEEPPTVWEELERAVGIVRSDSQLYPPGTAEYLRAVAADQGHDLELSEWIKHAESFRAAIRQRHPAGGA